MTTYRDGKPHKKVKHAPALMCSAVLSERSQDWYGTPGRTCAFRAVTEVNGHPLCKTHAKKAGQRFVILEKSPGHATIDILDTHTSIIVRRLDVMINPQHSITDAIKLCEFLNKHPEKA